MIQHLISALFGILGGLVPGGLKLAWNIRRGSTIDAGNIDLTAYRTKQQ